MKSAYRDNDTGATNDLPSLPLLVDLTKARPFAEFLVGIDAKQWDAVFGTQSGDELLIHGLIAAVGKDAQKSLTPAEAEITVGLTYEPLSSNIHST